MKTLFRSIKDVRKPRDCDVSGNSWCNVDGLSENCPISKITKSLFQKSGNFSFKVKYSESFHANNFILSVSFITSKKLFQFIKSFTLSIWNLNILDLKNVGTS